MGRAVASKLATGKRTLGGKENGTLPMAGKEYGLDQMPAAPAHQIAPHRRQESRGYDRYAGQEYVPREAAPPMVAW